MAYIKLSPEIIHAVAWDAGCDSCRRAGRTRWTAEDYNVAARVSEELWSRLDVVVGSRLPEKSRQVAIRRAISPAP